MRALYLAFFIATVIHGQAIDAQGRLPMCQPEDLGRWHNRVGARSFPNGDTYAGEWANDQKSGHGAYTYSNGDKYVGMHLADQPNGAGVFFFRTGARYVGHYKNGWRDGSGIFTCANGERYVVEFKGDRRDGFGVLLSFDDRVLRSGNWNGDNVDSAPLRDNSGDVAAQRAELLRRQSATERLLAEAREQEQLAREADDIAQQLLAAQDSKRAAELERARAERALVEAERRRTQTVIVSSTRRDLNASDGKKVTLVIGNASYRVQPLVNPVNESGDIAKSLKSRGFLILERTNVTLAEMRRAVREFSDQIADSQVALVYYAAVGHHAEAFATTEIIQLMTNAMVWSVDRSSSECQR